MQPARLQSRFFARLQTSTHFYRLVRIRTETCDDQENPQQNHGAFERRRIRPLRQLLPRTRLQKEHPHLALDPAVSGSGRLRYAATECVRETRARGKTLITAVPSRLTVQLA